MSRSLFILFVLFTAVASATTSPFHVMIDPGHGGSDSGAVYGEAKESEIALNVSLELKKLFEKESDFKVSITRTTDIHLELEERVRKAEKEKADIFLSLHANASQDPRAKGVEFYFQNHLEPEEESLYLANLENKIYNEQVSVAAGNEPSSSTISKKSDVLAIIEDLKRNTKIQQSHLLSKKLMQAWKLQRKSRTLRQAPFVVITKTKVPSVLVELGFVSNAQEAEKLQQSAYQKQLAQRIFTGVKDFKEMVDKSELRSLH